MNQDRAMTFPNLRPRRMRPTWLAPALALALAACGTAGQYRDAQRLFDQGEYVQATAEYARIADANPDNVRYRQTWLLKRREALDVLFRRAESARTSGNLGEAESLYQAALQVEPGNAQALEWLHRLGDMRRHAELLVKIDELIAAGQLDPAESMLHTVLAENPGNLRAQNSQERLRTAREAEKAKATAATGLDAGFTKPVTLEFRDVPVRVAFDVLSKASGINFVYDQDVRPDLKVSVFLRNTPLDEAVRLLGLSTQLETRVLNANTMLVYPNTPAKVADYRELSVRSFYLANADAKAVAETLKTLLKTESIVVDEKLNLLVMRDSPEAIALAEKLIALQDIGEPEVVLDVDVLEIKKSKLLDLGIALPTEIGVGVGGSDTNASRISLEDLRHLTGDDIRVSVPSASVKLRDERSDARILANPKIRVKSREKASVLIGDKVPVITTTQTATGFSSESINYVDVGLKLEVEPSVYAGDEVSIRINLEVSNLVREISSQNGTLAYQIGTRNAQTTLRLRDGETQVLAGLINKEERKVGGGWPGLSRFPVLDRIFGSTKNDHQDTEIVLSITPHLVRGIRRANIQDLQFTSGTATNLGGGANRAAVVDAAAAPAGEDTAGAANALPEANPAPAQPLVSPANPPAVAPVTGTPPAGDGPGVLLDWSVPAEVRVGEQFTAVLNISALRPLEQLPLLVGFDPKVLQVVSVEEGSFMAQGGGSSSLTKQVNLSDGKVTATVIRQGSAVTGQGTLLQVTFKALVPADGAAIRLLSATPGPESTGPARLADATVRIQ
jgi:general secretion pathway protein D